MDFSVTFLHIRQSSSVTNNYLTRRESGSYPAGIPIDSRLNYQEIMIENKLRNLKSLGASHSERMNEPVDSAVILGVLLGEYNLETRSGSLTDNMKESWGMAYVGLAFEAKEFDSGLSPYLEMRAGWGVDAKMYNADLGIRVNVENVFSYVLGYRYHDISSKDKGGDVDTDDYDYLTYDKKKTVDLTLSGFYVGIEAYF